MSVFTIRLSTSMAMDISQGKIGFRRIPEDAAYGIGDVFRLQLGGCHLVQERKEGVVVVPIDDQDVNGFARQGSDGPEAAKTGTDHDYTRFTAVVHSFSLRVDAPCLNGIDNTEQTVYVWSR